MMDVNIYSREQVKSLLNTDANVAIAILGLYARQTADEQESADTVHQNGRGFNFQDAPFLTSIAQALPRWRNRMTPKQLAAARKMLPKYHRQLREIFAEAGLIPPLQGQSETTFAEPAPSVRQPVQQFA